ncbi:MAG: ABC transporter ATP-binding protein, partial [Hyphomicrobiales bacterium]|nr:ABC transporter ATP-binding protein [Hyphomicrobiales bacterium]
MSDSAASRPVIAVENLVKHFELRRSWFQRDVASVHAVDDISFAIAAGSTLALVGESGCGKSTTARLILQLERPDSGTIILDGQPVTRATPELRQNVQMIFQDPYASLTPHFRVESILREPLMVHRICARNQMRTRIASALEAVGLSQDVMSRYPHELSGGQRQRVGIARAISIEPKLIVCDEPVSALDVSIRSQIINLLLDLQQSRNLAFLFISHDLDLVAHVSDSVAVMYLGKIVERAPTEAFFAGPKHPYSRALLDSSLTPDPRRRIRHAPLQGEVASPTDLPTGCRFRPRCPFAIDKCAEVEPPLRSMGAGHFSACHRAEELLLRPESAGESAAAAVT